jgi:hypothetical protein
MAVSLSHSCAACVMMRKWCLHEHLLGHARGNEQQKGLYVGLESRGCAMLDTRNSLVIVGPLLGPVAATCFGAICIALQWGAQPTALQGLLGTHSARLCHGGGGG